MPTYIWYCPDCDTDWEAWQSIHDDSKPNHTCGRMATKVVAVPALHGVGSRGSETRRVDSKEKQWDKDMPAYKRLRREGHQPRKIDGADKLEATALGNWHIQTGQRHTDDKIYSAQEQAKQIVRDAGLPLP